MSNVSAISEKTISTAGRHFHDLYSGHQPPGCGWAFIQDGQIVHKDFAGVAALSNPKSLDEHSHFRIASISKSFTAVATLMLRDRGLFDLDAEVRTVCGSLRLPSNVMHLTTRQLLSMTAGLPTDDPAADRFLGSTDDEYTAILTSQPLQVYAGAQRCNYSNYSYILLGRILSIVSGTSAHKFIIDEVCRPLGMLSTMWHPDPKRRVEGHHKVDGVWREEPEAVCRGDGDAFAGLWSTISDLTKWIAFLSVSDGRYSHIFDPRSAAELRAPRHKIPWSDTTDASGTINIRQYAHYAYGLRSYQIEDELYCGHSGGLPGYSSHIRWHPESKTAVIGFTNATYGPIWTPCALALHEIVKARAATTHEPPRVINQRADELLGLVRSFDETKSSEMFSKNVFQDKTNNQIESELRSVADKLGPTASVKSIRMTAGLEAEMTLQSDLGTGATIVFSLSPYDGGKVQAFTIRSL